MSATLTIQQLQTVQLGFQSCSSIHSAQLQSHRVTPQPKFDSKRVLYHGAVTTIIEETNHLSDISLHPISHLHFDDSHQNLIPIEKRLGQLSFYLLKFPLPLSFWISTSSLTEHLALSLASHTVPHPAIVHVLLSLHPVTHRKECILASSSNSLCLLPQQDIHTSHIDVLGAMQTGMMMGLAPIDTTDVVILILIVTSVSCVRRVETDRTGLGRLHNISSFLDRENHEALTVKKTVSDIGSFLATSTISLLRGCFAPWTLQSSESVASNFCCHITTSTTLPSTLSTMSSLPPLSAPC